MPERSPNTVTKDEPSNIMQVGPLRFAQFAEPLGAPMRKTPRWAWYDGTPCSTAEISRRTEALIKARLVSGM